MFKCRICKEKDGHIEFLEKQNKDLYDRLMAFNKDAFIYYKAENKKGEILYPIGVDKNGKTFSYQETNSEETRDDVYRAMGEFPVTVEDKNG